jgi:APA family basic amino acid/polyamine antiporter
MKDAVRDNGHPVGPSARPELIRALGPVSAFCVITGLVIGSGVFLVASPIARSLPSPGWALLVWVVAGLCSLTGALLFAELGAMYPGAGGQYVYLREAFGPLWGFLFGWTHALILLPGTLAALATGFAEFWTAFHPLSDVEQKWLATGSIVLFTGINLLGVTRGAAVLDGLTGTKVLALVALAAGGTITAVAGLAEPTPGPQAAAPTADGFSLAAFGVALIPAFWAFDGWQGLSQVAGEIREPQRTIPRASLWGMATVLLLYLAVNATYYLVLPVASIAATKSVGLDAARALWGEIGAQLLSAVVILSSLGSLNGTVLTGARVIYALARDGAFPAVLGWVDRTHHVPSGALIFQLVLAVALVWSNTYDELAAYVVCAAFLFYALTAAALIRLRQTRPLHPRPYRLPYYPLLPLVYLAGVLAFVVNNFWEQKVQALIGFAIVTLGVPAWWLSRKWHVKHEKGAHVEMEKGKETNGKEQGEG